MGRCSESALEQDPHGASSAASAPRPGDALALAFDADDRDHCETDIRAYRHVVLLLRHVARQLGLTVKDDSPRCELRLWDPYFCQGSVVRHLASLGFPKVHNRNEDFYVVRRDSQPKHDVLITNPPYSGDHIERLIRFCAASAKPWLALLPNWVFEKPWYQQLLSENAFGVSQPFFLGPVRAAYGFRIPPGAWRPEHVGADGRTTPYLASWFVHLPDAGAAEDLFRYLRAMEETQSEWVVAKSLQGLKEQSRMRRAPARTAFRFK